MKKKNLLFVFADQWRRAAMGFAEQDPVHTPRMDDFAAKSMYCENATSSFPLCSPHRACLFTGKWPQSTGMFTNCKPGLSLRLGDNEQCIAETMKDSGYKTAYIGKWHLDEPEINHCANPVSGARDWDAYTPPGIRRHGFDFWYTYNTYDMHMTPHYWTNSPKQILINQWSPQHETDVAIDYMKNRDTSKPFAMFVSWNPPHSPYNLVPEQYLSIYRDKKLTPRGNVAGDHLTHHTPDAGYITKKELEISTKEYFAAVSGLDEQFGRILDELKAQNLDQDTIVVLSSDHGDMMGSHGLMGKHVWYEESIGIPFVIGGAGVKAGRCGTVLGSADIAPTLLDMLGIPVPEQMEGKSISADILSGAGGKDSFTYLYACPGGLQLIDSLQKAGIDPSHMGWRGIRSHRYTYIVNAGYTQGANMQHLLYDLQEDNLQKNPLILQDPNDSPVAKKLKDLLKTWLAQQKDGFLQWL